MTGLGFRAARGFLGAGVLLGLLLAAPARAETVERAQVAFASGAFLKAAQAGEASQTPVGLSLAARALLAHCVTAEQVEARPLIERAIANAAAALREDSQSVEARLQLSLAIGMKARRMSVPEALRAGYAGKGKKLLQEALALAPNEPWAHALMGGWHLEVLRRGGPAGAAMVGAGFERGVAAFERARALAPDDATITLHYAAALLQLDPEKHKERVAGLLAVASRARADDAFEADMQAEARALADVLKSQGAQAAAALAASRLS